MGKLDPVAGDKSPARKRFLEKKLEEMEGSGDSKLMNQDEIEELSTFDLGTQMDEAAKKTLPKIDDKLLKNYNDEIKKDTVIQWACATCTYLNDKPLAPTCFLCGTKR